MNAQKTNHWLSVLLHDITPFPLIFLAPFFCFIIFNDYGAFKPETGLVASGLILVGLFFAVLYKQSQWGTKLLLATIGITGALSFFSGWQSLPALLITFFTTLLLTMVLAEDMLKLALTFAAVFILGIIFLPMKKQLSDPQSQQRVVQPVHAQLPPLVYLILDEHTGLDALPPNDVKAQALKQALTSFYQDMGFKFYSDAYSHYSATYNSIPNLLNFSLHYQDDYYFKSFRDHVLRQNYFFNLLSKMGYRINVYQSDYIDYTQGEGARIHYSYTYPSLSIKLIQSIHLPFTERLVFLTKSFLLQSYLYQISMRIYQYYLQPSLVHYGWLAPEWAWDQARVSSLSMLDNFAKLKEDIVKHPEGTVFFGHILAPHNPYAFDADCKLLPVADWQVTEDRPPLVNTPDKRAKRYSLYEGQISCLQKQLHQLFKTMQQAGIYDKSIIILHGDHGSRIGLHPLIPEYTGKLTQQDFNDYYLTFFASKIPGQNPGAVNRLEDLQGLFTKTARTITGAQIAFPDRVPYVYLYPTVERTTMVKMALSDFLGH